MRPATPGHRHSQDSRPDRCHPVADRPPAQAQALDAGSRERVRRPARSLRRAVRLVRKPGNSVKQLHCGDAATV
jgi:hypothetical protein